MYLREKVHDTYIECIKILSQSKCNRNYSSFLQTKNAYFAPSIK